jgi:hypothetical protein
MTARVCCGTKLVVREKEREREKRDERDGQDKKRSLGPPPRAYFLGSTS